MIWLWYLAVIFIPVGTRMFLGALTPGLSEYTGRFLYISDFLIAALLVFFVLRRRKQKLSASTERPFLKGLIACAALAVFILPTQADLPGGASLYGFIRLLLLVGFLFLIPFFISNKKIFKTTLLIIAALALLEAGLGIYQFARQQDAGLQILGESPLSQTIPGVSKIAVGSLAIVRAYGTFPHPNILAAFLIFGLLSLSYLYISYDAKLYVFNARLRLSVNFKRFVRNRAFFIRLLIAGAVFIVILGLGLTFSRGGWLSAAMALVIFSLLLWRTQARAVSRLLALVIISATFAFGLLSPLLSSRITESVASSPAFSERVLYNGIGIYIVKHYPFGVGIGNQVNFALQQGFFYGLGLNAPWQWQPAHNLYLLMAAEIGILGLLCFLVFSIILMKRTIANGLTLERATALAIFTALLIFGLFDHFLWDLEPGQLMLWLSIGLVLAASRFAIRSNSVGK